MRDTVEAYNRRIKDFEEHQKARSRQLAAFMGHQQQVAAAIQVIFGNDLVFLRRIFISTFFGVPIGAPTAIASGGLDGIVNYKRRNCDLKQCPTTSLGDLANQ